MVRRERGALEIAMKIRKTTVVLAVLDVLGAAAASLAATTVVMNRRGAWGGASLMGRLIDDPSVQEQLKLTPDQITRLHTIRDQARDSIREMRATSIRARADLRATLLDTKASRQDIEKSAAAVREATSALSQEVTRRLLDARDVLSVDQREELLSIVQERAGARRGLWRRPPGFRRGNGPMLEDGAADDTTTE